MKTVCASVVLLLATMAGCCDCGNCCPGLCPAPGAAPYAAQRQPLSATQQQLAQSQVEKTGAAAVQAERQVQYYDGNQPKTFLR